MAEADQISSSDAEGYHFKADFEANWKCVAEEYEKLSKRVRKLSLFSKDSALFGYFLFFFFSS